ncbi:MAG: FG-GAP-like repeat-containing protein, partial [Flavitalea sp.]
KGVIGNAPETYSNGSVYADFDNDGDLDIVVNNIDEPATFYRNNARQPQTSDSAEQPNAYLRLNLTGSKSNPRAIGAKAIVFAGKEKRVYEKFAVHGFQSSSEGPIQIGLGGATADSIKLVWPDNTFEQVSVAMKDTLLNIVYKEGLAKFDYLPVFHQLQYEGAPCVDITSASGLNFQHKENLFNEFNREQLMPHMLSTEGPAIAAGDFDGDGLQDLFLGAARNSKSQIWIQQPEGKFRLSSQPALDADSAFEDVSATWIDVNKDGKPDLVVGSGGNEFYGGSEFQQPRLYLNDGKALIRKQDAFPKMNTTVSVVTAADFNKDGAPDLFVGGRAVPMEYGSLPQSYLLMNDGTGKFRDVSNINVTGLSNAGFVTNASWVDIDKNGDPDLLVSYEWGPLKIFLNNGGSLKEKQITDKKGWWNFMIPVDIDNDGDLDLIAGNLGLNSRLKASSEEPVKMYQLDFDGNGRKEQVVTYFINHKELPFASIAELSKQMPVLKKKFLYAGEFAKATLEEIFDESKLNAAASYSADYMSNAVLINDGNQNFELQELPWEAQLTSYRDAVVIDANKDSLPDLLLVGNYFDSNTEMGRYDADMGTILINKGGGGFKVETLNGAVLKGQSRHVVKLNNGLLVVARNNDSAVVLKF